MLLMTLISTRGTHSSPSPHPCAYVPYLENSVDKAGAPSCVLGAVNAPLEPLALWLKFPPMPGILFFFFGFLGNDSLSESQLFAAKGGGGRIFPRGALGGVGMGAASLPQGTLSTVQATGPVG